MSSAAIKVNRAPNQYGAGISAGAQLLRKRACWAHEQRAEDSANCAGKDDQPDDASAIATWPHFGGDIASLLACPIANAGETCTEAKQKER